MTRFTVSLRLLSLVLTSVTATAALTGCTIGQFPAGSAATPQAATADIGTIQGSNFGGHAPIVGGKIFVLEANPAATGYGHLVKSLLTSTSANASFPTAQDTTQGSPTNGMYYVTTNNVGQFYLSGDYTCDIGYPVYLYAAGGNPQAGTPTSLPPSIAVTGATGNDVTLNYATGSTTSGTQTNDYVVTFTTSGTQLLYQGESITFAATGIPSGSYSGFNGGTYTVSPYKLTTTTFSIDLGAGSGSIVPAQAQQSFTTSVTQATSPSNQGIANMALLGVCGDTSPTNATPTGTANFSSLNFVFMNEVSTAATAYTMAGFFQTPSYTFTTTVGSLTHNGVTVVPGVQNNLGHLTVTGSTTGTVTVTGAVISNSGYTVTMTASGPVSASDSLTYSSTDTVASGTFGAYISGASGTPAGSYTTTDALHLSVPSTSSMALTGLQNAARNAALLYDIQGGSVGTNSVGTSCSVLPSSPPCDGDAHIARSVTPNAAAGTVPQSLINTVANIIANCVDSANLYGVTNTSGAESGQCSTLFGTARNDGTTTGIQPYDTATAAINIAHFPGGAKTNTTYATNLFNSQTGNVPFVPNLSSAPHDFAVAILYQTPSASLSDIAIDTSGDVWTIGTAANKVLELAPSGTYTTYTPPNGSTMSSGITIDTAGTVFATAAAGVVKFTPGNLTGTLIGASNTALGGQIVVDGSDNLYIADFDNPNGLGAGYYQAVSGVNLPLANSNLVKESSTGTAAGGNFPVGPGVANAAQNTAQSCIPAVSSLALDSSNNIWTSNVNNTLNPGATICRFSSAGVFQYSFSVTPGTDLGLPHAIAVDSGNNAWFAEKDQGFVYKIAAGSTVSNSGTTLASGGSLSAPKGVAVDGANSVWVSNTGTAPGTLVQYSNAATAITPTYLTGTGYGGSGYLNLSVDQAGNVWAVDSGGNLVQYIGIASPTAQPFSVARAGVGLGSKP